MQTRWLNKSVEVVAQALKPQKVDGKWRGSQISKRIAAAIRKDAIRNNLYGQWVEGQGGWLEEWDLPQKAKIPRPNKGHLRERNKDERIDKILKGLSEQDKRLEAHYAAIRASKVKTGLDKWIKKEAWEK